MASTVNSRGQITIPKQVRDRLGIRAGSTVAFELNDSGEIVLRCVAQADGQPASGACEPIRQAPRAGHGENADRGDHGAHAAIRGPPILTRDLVGLESWPAIRQTIQLVTRSTGSKRDHCSAQQFDARASSPCRTRIPFRNLLRGVEVLEIFDVILDRLLDVERLAATRQASEPFQAGREVVIEADRERVRHGGRPVSL